MKKNQENLEIPPLETPGFEVAFFAGIPIFYGSGSFCSANYFCILLLLLCISFPTSWLFVLDFMAPEQSGLKIPF